MLPQVSRKPLSQEADVVTGDYCEAQLVQGSDAERNHSDMVRCLKQFILRYRFLSSKSNIYFLPLRFLPSPAQIPVRERTEQNVKAL